MDKVDTKNGRRNTLARRNTSHTKEVQIATATEHDPGPE